MVNLITELNKLWNGAIVETLEWLWLPAPNLLALAKEKGVMYRAHNPGSFALLYKEGILGHSGQGYYIAIHGEPDAIWTHDYRDGSALALRNRAKESWLKFEHRKELSDFLYQDTTLKAETRCEQ